MIFTQVAVAGERRAAETIDAKHTTQLVDAITAVVEKIDAEKALVKEFGFAASKPLDANAYAPKSPPGSRVLYLTSATETLTVILQPWREREALKLGDVVRGVVVARGGDASAPSAFVDARASNVPFLSRPCADYVA